VHYPWYLTAAVIALSFCLAIAATYVAVWFGDRHDAREYRRRTQPAPPVPLLPQPLPPSVPVEYVPRHRPRLPLPMGTPVPGVPLVSVTRPYRRQR